MIKIPYEIENCVLLRDLFDMLSVYTNTLTSDGAHVSIQNEIFYDGSEIARVYISPLLCCYESPRNKCHLPAKILVIE